MELMTKKTKLVPVKLKLMVDEAIAAQIAELQENTPEDHATIEDVVAEFVTDQVRRHAKKRPTGNGTKEG